MEYHSHNISGDTSLFLQLLEIQFESNLAKIVRTSIYSHLSVQYAMSLEDDLRGAPAYKIESNASLDLDNSYSLVSRIDDFFRNKSQELDQFLSGRHQILVKLVIGNKESPKSHSEAKGELPYFLPVAPRYAFQQIILPEDLRSQIDEALNIIKHQELIYNVWGFSEVDSIPRSILNFYGPPGTGKTMCAHAIASEVDKKILALNYAEIESKYVGEAPKNLQRAFDIARDEDCVLFFDEADSFLGKRIGNVTQGADQALNSLRSQMLILLEEFNGLVIFATNLIANFDSAFESRILKHLKFELPNEEARMSIIKKMIPTKLPLERSLEENELRELSRILDGLSGREIKNAILETLLSKASDDQSTILFNYKVFEKGFLKKKEQYKMLQEAKGADKRAKIINAIKNGRVTEQNTEEVQDEDIDNASTAVKNPSNGKRCQE